MFCIGVAGKTKKKSASLSSVDDITRAMSAISVVKEDLAPSTKKGEHCNASFNFKLVAR